MNKLFLIIILAIMSTYIIAQTSVNKDGSLKFRGNVAILVEGRSFTFKNGQLTKQINDRTSELVKTAIRALCMQKFQNFNFGIVNRDNEASNKVNQLIEENKLEDYLDGFSVQAKGEGADYLYIAEITSYSEDDKAAQIEISTRLLNVENNFGYHSSYKSDVINLKNTDEIKSDIQKIVNEFSEHIDKQLTVLFPEQYFIAKTDGKFCDLGAYQTNGVITKNDHFYIFRFKKENMNFGTNNIPIQILDLISTGKVDSNNNGYLRIKTDDSIKDASNTIVFKNLNQPLFFGTNQILITFFGLHYGWNSYDDLVKNRINNAVYNSITKHPGAQLIEHDHLSELKQERELQKSEEFINGHTVSQMKAIGAKVLVHLENFQRKQMQVTFTLSFISVEENRITRSVEITTSIDNIENEIYKQLCERIAYPCTIKMINKNKIELNSVISLHDNNNCILEITKAIQNPLTNEISYSVSDLCTLNFKEYHGNMSIFEIDKIFNTKDIKNLEQASKNGSLTFRIDGTKIESNIDSNSKVQQKAQKSKKQSSFMKALKNAGKTLLENTSIQIQQNGN